MLKKIVHKLNDENQLHQQLIYHELIIIMNNYNLSSYYRANPYADLGYMPPIAQKNRKKPDYGTELPQGEEFFQPTMKKHYGRSYQTEIQADHIMASPEKRSLLEDQAMQRSYFRSLNSKDIEGATTNTLISKAVRNKMKAQQMLAKKKQNQMLERMKQQGKDRQPNLYSMYHQPKQSQKNQINFHTIQKQREQEYMSKYNNHRQFGQEGSGQYNLKEKQADLYRKAHEKIQNSGYYSPKNYHQQNFRNIEDKFQNKQPYQSNAHEYQTSLNQQMNSKSQKPHSYHGQEAKNNYHSMQRNDDYMPTTQQRNDNYMPTTLQRNQNYIQQQRSPQNYQKYSYQAPPPTYQRREFEPKENNNKVQYGGQRSYQNYEEQRQANSGKIGFKNNQEHRKFNPTYLSYGSPSFNLAGRHLAGQY